MSRGAVTRRMILWSVICAVFATLVVPSLAPAGVASNQTCSRRQAAAPGPAQLIDDLRMKEREGWILTDAGRQLLATGEMPGEKLGEGKRVTILLAGNPEDPLATKKALRLQGNTTIFLICGYDQQGTITYRIPFSARSTETWILNRGGIFVPKKMPQGPICPYSGGCQFLSSYNALASESIYSVFVESTIGRPTNAYGWCAAS